MYRVSPPPGDDGTVPEGVKFSEAVKEAISLGMMEVDPVKDLNNEVRRKLSEERSDELGTGIYIFSRLYLATLLIFSGYTSLNNKTLTSSLCYARRSTRRGA